MPVALPWRSCDSTSRFSGCALCHLVEAFWCRRGIWPCLWQWGSVSSALCQSVMGTRVQGASPKAWIYHQEDLFLCIIGFNSHASSVVPLTDCQCVHQFGPGWNIWTTIGWIDELNAFCVDICGSRRMKSFVFGDTLSPDSSATMRCVMVFLIRGKIGNKLWYRHSCCS